MRRRSPKKFHFYVLHIFSFLQHFHISYKYITSWYVWLHNRKKGQIFKLSPVVAIGLTQHVNCGVGNGELIWEKTLFIVNAQWASPIYKKTLTWLVHAKDFSKVWMRSGRSFVFALGRKSRERDLQILGFVDRNPALMPPQLSPGVFMRIQFEIIKMQSKLFHLKWCFD